MKAFTPAEVLGEQRRRLVAEQTQILNEALTSNYSDEWPFVIGDRRNGNDYGLSPYLVCIETLRAFCNAGWDVYCFDRDYAKMIQFKRSDMNVGEMHNYDPKAKDAP